MFSAYSPAIEAVAAEGDQEAIEAQAAVEEVYADTQVSIIGNELSVDLTTGGSMSKIFLRATTRGDVQSYTKEFTFAVCEFPLLSAAEEKSIYEDYDG
jgi:hypothetical protein